MPRLATSHQPFVCLSQLAQLRSNVAFLLRKKATLLRKKKAAGPPSSHRAIQLSAKHTAG